MIIQFFILIACVACVYTFSNEFIFTLKTSNFNHESVFDKIKTICNLTLTAILTIGAVIGTAISFNEIFIKV